MSEDNRPAEAVPEVADVTTAEGQAKVSESLSLEQINAQTGRDYKDMDSALKGIQETYKHVGKPPAAEPPKQEAPTGDNALAQVAKIQKDLEEERFFRQNPDLQPFEKHLKSIAGDRPLTEVAESEEVKELLTKAQAHDATEKRKSTVMSSPRLAATTDKLKEAADAQAQGNSMAAGKLATKAVMEAMGE